MNVQLRKEEKEMNKRSKVIQIFFDVDDNWDNPEGLTKIVC